MFSGRRGWIAAGILVLAGTLGPAARAQSPATGPLRRLESNPRYFTDGSGKADLARRLAQLGQLPGQRPPRCPAGQDPPPAFDFDGYLDFLQKHNHNFFRLWRWEAPKWTDAQPAGTVKYCRPHPWKRTGPGPGGRRQAEVRPDVVRPRVLRPAASSGSSRPATAGIYVSIMLFEGWEMQFTDAWKYHPFHGPNNVNGVDADPDGRGLLYNQLRDDAMGKKVLALRRPTCARWSTR